MNLIESFEIAGGTVPGTDHTKPGRPGWKNNQDAYAWRLSPEVMVGVVCDGCGSGKHSEVGAKLGARIMADTLFSLISSDPVFFQDNLNLFIPVLEFNVVAKLQAIVKTMFSITSSNQAIVPLVHEYFLFTTIFFIVTPEMTYLYSLGDGVYAINGEPVILGPFPNNQPPYIGYRIPDYDLRPYNGPFCFYLNASLPTEEMKSLFIGTDGITHFIENEETVLHRTKKPLGSLNQFWKQDIYFINNDAVRRTLAVANHEYVDGKRIRSGPLFDDVALVVVREKRERGIL